MGIKGNNISPLAVTLLVFIIGLGTLIYSILFSTWDIIAYVCLSPFFLITAIQALRNPFVGVCLPIHIQLLFYSLVQIHAR